MINIAMMLKPSSRTPEGVAYVQSIANKLGFLPTTKGERSVSFRIDAEAFQRVFGLSAQPLPPLPSTDSDFGAPGGYSISAELIVPSELQEYVESIVIVPPARRF